MVVDLNPAQKELSITALDLPKTYVRTLRSERIHTLGELNDFLASDRILDGFQEIRKSRATAKLVEFENVNGTRKGPILECLTYVWVGVAVAGVLFLKMDSFDGDELICMTSMFVAMFLFDCGRWSNPEVPMVYSPFQSRLRSLIAITAAIVGLAAMTDGRWDIFGQESLRVIGIVLVFIVADVGRHLIRRRFLPAAVFQYADEDINGRSFSRLFSDEFWEKTLGKVNNVALALTTLIGTLTVLGTAIGAFVVMIKTEFGE